MKITAPTPVVVTPPPAPPTPVQMVAKALKELAVGSGVTFSSEIKTWMATQGVTV
jgi:hypothetical protein